MNWQPIETAPKFSVRIYPIILGFKPDEDGGWPSCQGYWCELMQDWMVASPFNPSYALLSEMTEYLPTHWMPMPDVPDNNRG